MFCFKSSSDVFCALVTQEESFTNRKIQILKVLKIPFVLSYNLRNSPRELVCVFDPLLQQAGATLISCSQLVFLFI